MPHCEHLILAPSASQLPQRPAALPLPSLVLPCALLFALPLPFLRGVPSAPPRSSGGGRWKTVGSYEAVVVEEEMELFGSGCGSSAAPLPPLLLRELIFLVHDVVASRDAMALAPAAVVKEPTR